MADEQEDQENPSQLLQNDHRRHCNLAIRAKYVHVLTKLYKKVQHGDDADKIDYSEKEVYRRLMSDLEGVENKFPDISKIAVSIEILFFMLHFVFLFASLTVPRIEQTRLLQLPIWQWIALSFSFISGFSIVLFITYLICHPIRRYWRIQRYVVYVIHSTKKSADVTLWLGSVLLVWFTHFRPHLKHSQGDTSVFLVHKITRLFIALDLGAFLWFLKDIMYLKLEADVHYNQLFVRITLSVIYFHALKAIEQYTTKNSDYACAKLPAKKIPPVTVHVYSPKIK